MCIRDSYHAPLGTRVVFRYDLWTVGPEGDTVRLRNVYRRCLLYTSDAADERSSVDLGGRRIIKKKNNRSPRRDLTSKRNNSHTQRNIQPQTKKDIDEEQTKT